MITILLTQQGVERVLNGEAGMTFLVDTVTQGANGPVAHVRDYRKSMTGSPVFRQYAIWSLGAGDYEVIEPPKRHADPITVDQMALTQQRLAAIDTLRDAWLAEADDLEKKEREASHPGPFEAARTAKETLRKCAAAI